MLETKPPGAILDEDERYNASLIRREDAHESLATFWVKFDGDPTPFESGQYMTIGVFTEGDGTAPPRIVQRPYSIASDPQVAGTDGYEMYVRLVEGGLFTPLLWQLPVGHRLRMIGPKGKFVLEPDDDRTHLFISSGTGNAPFVSMMKAMLREGRPRKAIFLNGVSYVRDLGYRELLEDWEQGGGYPVTFVPTVSRPSSPENAGLERAPGPGRNDRRAGVRRARPDARERDRLHLRQPGHDPDGRGDAPPARLPRGAGQEGALLAEGQGAPGRRRDGLGQGTLSLVRPGALLAMSIAAVGCIGSTATTGPARGTLPTDRVALADHPPCDASQAIPCVEAGRAIVGSLHTDGRCLWITLENGDDVRVIWPFGYAASKDLQTIYDAAGAVVARTGHMIQSEGSDPTQGEPDGCGRTVMVVLAGPVHGEPISD